MISEFICLDEFQKSEHESTYICSLPDPDPDSDFGMVICGYINIRERIGSKEFLIKIEMLDNFEKLWKIEQARIARKLWVHSDGYRRWQLEERRKKRRWLKKKIQKSQPKDAHKPHPCTQ